ncbi:MAG: cytochrome C [Verrucomicrobia bacterium]|nr:MAG: cytochrome C [Verrucomicrobiota bacterium]
MPADVQPESAIPDSAEPTALRRPVPVWLLVVLFLLIWWGLVYFDQRSAWGDMLVYAPYHSLEDVKRFQPPHGEGPDIVRGEKLFNDVCGVCHQKDGMGKPGQFPPLAGSEWAQGNPNRVIRIPVLGLQGSITVKGVEWNQVMASVNTSFTDDDLANVLTYVRQAWGNKAPPITAEQVKTVRTAIGNRSQPLNGAAELESIQ